MDKFKAFLSDKKNTPIVGAVAGIVLVLVVLFYLKQFGIIGGSSGGGTATPTDIMNDPATATSAPADGGMTPPGVAPGDPSATGATPAPAAPVNIDRIAPMFAYRKDPFMGFAGPPQKKDALMAILPGVQRIRLAPARVTPPPRPEQEVEEPMPPQPMRRVAGIMWGPTVKAIIESGGKTHVVVPGQMIPDERVRVESIEPSGVILTTLDTKRPMRIRVNLAGSPMAQQDGSGNMGNEAPPPDRSNLNRGGSRGGSSGMPREEPPPGF